MVTNVKKNCLVLHSPIDDNHLYYLINGHKCTRSSLSTALPLSWQSLILVHQCTKSLLNPAFPLLTTTHTIWSMAINVTSFCQVLHSHMNGNHVTNTKGGGSINWFNPALFYWSACKKQGKRSCHALVD